MNKHGTIVFVENVASDVYEQIGSNPDQVLIEGGMVQFAEGKSVRHHGHSQGILVGDDVRGIQQLLMPEPAECASRNAIGPIGAPPHWLPHDHPGA